MNPASMVPLFSLFSLSPCFLACGPTPGERVQQNVRTFKADQRADKLTAAGRKVLAQQRTTWRELLAALQSVAGLEPGR